MYKVPEDLRVDVENYRNNIEKKNEKQRRDGAISRYARRKVNRFSFLLKVSLAALTGVALISGIGKLMDDSNPKKSSRVLRLSKSTTGNNHYQSKHYPTAVQYNYESQPLAFAGDYVSMPVYSQAQSQSYTLWQPAGNLPYSYSYSIPSSSPGSNPGKQVIYVNR